MSYQQYIQHGPTIVPPRGKLVYDKDGEHVEGDTREHLIKNLTDQRLANHKRLGDPAQDVDKMLAEEKLYTSPIPVEAISRDKRSMSLIERVNSWLGNRRSLFKTLAYVSQVEAQRRAAICVRCPRNIEWRGCRGCTHESIREIEAETVKLSQDRRTPFHSRLKACGVAGHENRLAVFLTGEFLKHRVSYMRSLPNHCWLKRLEKH